MNELRDRLAALAGGSDRPLDLVAVERRAGRLRRRTRLTGGAVAVCVGAGAVVAATLVVAGRPATSHINVTAPDNRPRSERRASSGTTCLPSDMTLSLTGGAVQRARIFAVTVANSSTTPCTLSGVPSAAVTATSGVALTMTQNDGQTALLSLAEPAAFVTAISDSPVMTLSPGGTATFYVAWTTEDGSTCPPVVASVTFTWDEASGYVNLLGSGGGAAGAFCTGQDIDVSAIGPTEAPALNASNFVPEHAGSGAAARKGD